MKHNMSTLFGRKVISSINFNEQEIIRDILTLHAKGGPIECDPTYSVGNFYKKGLVEPEYKFDILPQAPGVVQASSEKLPLRGNSLKVIIFDPPFIAHIGTHGITNKRFTVFDTFEDLKSMYRNSLVEFYRVLKDKGIVIFKCQDFCGDGAIQYFTHAWVMEVAIKVGFYPKDLFIYLARNRIGIVGKQKIARKYHSYYWVFQKTKCKANYD